MNDLTTFDLFNFCDQGDLEGVISCLEKNVSLSSGYDFALRRACVAGHLSIVQALICAYSSLISEEEYSAFFAVIKNEHTHILKWFLEIGIIPDNILADGLYSASAAGSLKSLECLLPKVDVGLEQNKALMLAVSSSNIDVVKLLLKSGADVSAQNNLAITSSIQNGDLEMTSILLDLGASIEVAYETIVALDDSSFQSSKATSFEEIYTLVLELKENDALNKELKLSLPKTDTVKHRRI